MKTPVRILVVEDNPDLRYATVRVLKYAGYEAAEAATGREGLRMAKELQPDIILLDVVLPDIDGNEVCRHIKAESTCSNSFILMLSSLKTSSDEQAAGLESGADGYITRPIPNRELLARVKASLRIRFAETQRDAALRDLQQAHNALEIQVAERTAELAIANEKLRVRSRELEALNTLAREVGGSLSLDTVIHTALKQMEAAVAPELAMLFLREGDRLLLKDLRPQDSAHAHVETPEHRVGECLCGLAVQMRTPLYSLNIHNDPRCTWNECKRAGLRSIAAIPLRSNGDIFGVLALTSAAERDFSAQAVFLETLAGEVAIGIKNARLYEQSRQYALQLQDNLGVLRQARKEWEEIFQAIGHPTLILNTDFRVISANRAAQKATGKTEDELKGQACFEAFHMTGSPPDVCPLQKLLHSRHVETAEMEVEALHGMFFVSCTPVLDETGALQKIIHIATDITERKQADKALKESLARWESLAENTRDFIAILDRAGILRYVNHAYAGLTAEELLGTSVYEHIEPGYHASTRETLEQVFQMRKALGYELKAAGPEGTIRWCEARVNPLILEGEIPYVTLLLFDISDRKEAENILQAYSERLEEMVDERTRELRETQEKLLRQERLAALGQLAGGVGHELRTPLATILNAVYYLKMVLPGANADVAEYLEIVAVQSRKAEKIISDLLDFARVKRLQKERISALTTVEQIVNQLTLPEGIRLIWDVPDTSPDLWVDRQHFEQVVLNLLKNACDAMPDGGTLTVSARQAAESRRQTAENRRQAAESRRQAAESRRQAAESRRQAAENRRQAAENRRQAAESSEQSNRDSSLTTGHCLLLTVQDTGCGISEDSMQKLFEPLFTTKAKGIGLGLSIVKNLIEANGGAISVESKEGVGSAFTMSLPTVKTEASE